MAKCSVCSKGTVFGNSRSHAENKTRRTWKPNVRKVRVVQDGVTKSAYVCTRCLRSNKVTRAI